ncbi:MAG: NUDIX domain-containing protein, partial [Elusimicrobiota bacterium]
EKAFPGKWTVPGGEIEVLDYALKNKDTKHHWYNVLESLLKKEIQEEVGLEIENIDYITSMVYIRPDNVPCLIISFFAEPKESEVRLCKALTKHAWIDLKEAKSYELIEGIYEELTILDNSLKTGKKLIWSRLK